MSSHLWGETKYPSPEEQPPLPENPEASGAPAWIDPLDRWEKPEPKQLQKLDLASLLCGIFSVLLCCAARIAVLLGIPAIVLGIAAKKKLHGEARLAGFGIALGIISLCIGLGTLCFPKLFELLKGVAGGLMPH